MKTNCMKWFGMLLTGLLIAGCSQESAPTAETTAAPVAEAAVSSSMGEFSYDADSQVLTAKLQGGTYEYAEVPAEVFQQLQDAESPGKAFNELIKGTYESTKVE